MTEHGSVLRGISKDHPMTFSRRQFLSAAAGSTALIALSRSVPGFLLHAAEEAKGAAGQRSFRSANQSAYSSRVLAIGNFACKVGALDKFRSPSLGEGSAVFAERKATKRP